MDADLEISDDCSAARAYTRLLHGWVRINSSSKTLAYSVCQVLDLLCSATDALTACCAHYAILAYVM